jgi:hypothetical protein
VDPAPLVARARRDHRLSATERDEEQQQTSFDERARVIDDYVGDDFAPDESGRG